MSSRSNHWCWQQEDVSPAELLVMLAVSDRCDEAGFGSYQSLETIAKKSRMSERNVRRVVTDLEGRGKVKRHDRPGRTTEIQIVIPDDFGRRRRADKMSGVGGDNPSGGNSGAGSSEGEDNLSGVEPREAKMAGAPDRLAGGADKMAADSSLPIQSTYTKDARARAGPDQSPGRAAAPQVGGEEFLLDNQALQLGISKRQANETLADYRRRVQAAHDRKLHAAAAERAQRLRGEPPTTDEPESAPAAPIEEVA